VLLLASTSVPLEQCLLVVATVAKQFIYFRDSPPAPMASDSKKMAVSASKETDEGAAPAELLAMVAEIVLPLCENTLPEIAKHAATSSERSILCAYLIAKVHLVGCF
jgi:hypothetical protein